MSDYVDLGSRVKTGVADNTGNNTGNWTVAFTPNDFNVPLTRFEIYKIRVRGALGSFVNIYNEINEWDSSVYGANNAWEAVQPFVVTSGNTVYFYYSDPVTDNTPPTVTVWVRYDKTQAGN